MCVSHDNRCCSYALKGVNRLLAIVIRVVSACDYTYFAVINHCQCRYLNLLSMTQLVDSVIGIM